MRALDWVVLSGTILSIVTYGLYRGRGSNTINAYLLAGKSMPWYAMALSIMATQASAITFISTTAQGYTDGIRFLQFYLGLPIAMVILAATAVPIFHRANVYTAYEYLETRFDAKTRALVSAIFLIERGLADGVALCAPAIVLTVVLRWPSHLTIVIMGALVVAYTVVGGIKAVTWTEVQQMVIIFIGLAAALITALWLLPRGVGLGDAFHLAGAVGKLKAIDLTFDLDNRYNIWSGILGGTFLFLAYFGTDQSQVQRYLTGKSIAQSRLSLLFNAVAKIPMQFLILVTGAMVFVFFIYERPPLLFDPVELKAIQSDPAYPSVDQRYRSAFEDRKRASGELVESNRSRDAAQHARSLAAFQGAQNELDRARADGVRMVEKATGTGFTDTNYIFLSFVTHYMPAGIVGLIIAVIFVAATSSTAAEVNSLATVSVIDIYRRHIRREASDRHYLWASRIASAFWGCYVVVFAEYALHRLGSLIEAVNLVGSLFYGGMLGVFVLAFAFPRVRGTAAFTGVLAGEAAIFAAHFATQISFLWYNALGCIVVVLTGLALSLHSRESGAGLQSCSGSPDPPPC